MKTFCDVEEHVVPIVIDLVHPNRCCHESNDIWEVMNENIFSHISKLMNDFLKIFFVLFDSKVVIWQNWFLVKLIKWQYLKRILLDMIHVYVFMTLQGYNKFIFWLKSRNKALFLIFGSSNLNCMRWPLCTMKGSCYWVGSQFGGPILRVGPRWRELWIFFITDGHQNTNF